MNFLQKVVFQVGEHDTTIYDVKELLGATGWRKNPREANLGTEGLFGGYYGCPGQWRGQPARGECRSPALEGSLGVGLAVLESPGQTGRDWEPPLAPPGSTG